jgi:hypothetical protein
VPELLCGSYLVVEVAQVAGVPILIRAAMSERNNVIDHGGELSSAAVQAVLA